MRIAIIGASGRLGQQLLTLCLGLGYRVNALSRRPRAIRRAADNLTVYRGDVESGEGLQPFLEGCSKVIWAARCRRPHIGMQNVLDTIGDRRIGPVVMVSRLGVGESAAQARHAPGLTDKLVRWLRPGMFAELERTEDLLRNSRVPHVILRPARLTDDDQRGKVVTSGPAGKPPDPISRPDLARFIVRLLGEKGWPHTALTVGVAPVLRGPAPMRATAA